MPKIKDLGINTIPMRPPQIGTGGSLDNEGLQYFAAQEHTGCSEATCGRQQPRDSGGGGSDYTSGCSDASCAPDTSACGDTSCKPQDTSACGDTSCGDPRRSPSPKDKKKASAFHPDAIAQLRQQLESHIGM
ncbi:MAG TPA: hypothetical protein VEK79_19200 [Thermoanaerobaculia bacterium]|nr:hypothetical protein [Thermoanaerobaculia bacterium]